MNIRELIKEKGHYEGMQKGMQKGIQKGMQKGMQKGIQKGRKEERQNVALNMLKKNLDISLISEVTDLTKKEIKKLKNGAYTDPV